ncbi:hypothetical protein LSH36_241g04007 [Paralvinella palmiformis]|uniref:SRCR domain-containing protein n=1 Tax=Paralvinella palmiformis TaxID=53620 RepID=A0AAD9N3I9_9ANNE|nr:hypothetical protein LSH36_241g04007 [Paralvinella palmiformis]
MNAGNWLVLGIIFVSSATVLSSRFSIRLVGGRNDYEGRVEIYFSATDSWGTVCDGGWDDNDAHVVCRQLGLTGGTARMNAFYGQGTGDILLDGVMCAGTERHLAECAHKGWGVHRCDHKDDAGVMCNADIRLSGGLTGYDGRVEVYDTGGDIWGTVCGPNIDQNVSIVVCRQLGMTGGSVLNVAMFEKTHGSILLGEVSCEGTEDNVMECNHSSMTNAACRHTEDLAIGCDPVLRIVDGSSPFEGRVEVYDITSDTWGTICDKGWNENAAHVVCKYLGYAGDRVLLGGHVPPGSGPIHLSNVICDGTERSLLDCRHDGMDRNKCQHKEDAGVKCTPPAKNDRSVVCTIYRDGSVKTFSGRVIHRALQRRKNYVASLGPKDAPNTSNCKFALMAYLSRNKVTWGSFSIGVHGGKPEKYYRNFALRDVELPIKWKNVDICSRGCLNLCYEGHSYTKKGTNKSTLRRECSQHRTRSCNRAIFIDLEVESALPVTANSNRSSWSPCATRGQMTGGGYPVGASILGANVLGANVWGEESNKRKPNTTQININTHKLRWEKRQTKPPTYLTSFPHTMTNEDNSLNATVHKMSPNKGWIVAGGACPYSVTYRVKKKHPILMLKIGWGWHYKPDNMAGVCAL